MLTSLLFLAAAILLGRASVNRANLRIRPPDLSRVPLLPSRLRAKPKIIQSGFLDTEKDRLQTMRKASGKRIAKRLGETQSGP
jgi:hypothetical protein